MVWAHPSRGLVGLALAGFLLAACATEEAARPSDQVVDTEGPIDEQMIGEYKVGRPYQVAGVWYYPKVDYSYRDTGIASWYGPGFHGRRTANGEIFDQFDVSAAHPTLPMPSVVRVTNLENGRVLMVRVNDRGPFKNGRIIDMSRRGAQLLGFEGKGTAKVQVEIMEEESRQHAAAAQNRQLADAEGAPPAVPMVAVTTETLASPGGGTAQDDIAAAPAQTTLAQAPLRAAISWPEDKVTQRSVASTNIYIQAGAFLRRDYATRLSARLSPLAATRVVPTQVGSQHFFRVRLGPLSSVDAADRLLATLIAKGHTDARVVID